MSMSMFMYVTFTWGENAGEQDYIGKKDYAGKKTMLEKRLRWRKGDNNRACAVATYVSINACK